MRKQFIRFLVWLLKVNHVHVKWIDYRGKEDLTIPKDIQAMIDDPGQPLWYRGKDGSRIYI